MMTYIRGTQESTERASHGQRWKKKKKTEQENKIEFDYDPVLKINVHEFILI